MLGSPAGVVVLEQLVLQQLELSKKLCHQHALLLGQISSSAVLEVLEQGFAELLRKPECLVVIIPEQSENQFRVADSSYSHQWNPLHF